MARYGDLDKLAVATCEPSQRQNFGEIIESHPAANVETKSKWISVDERLPDEGEYVLIFAASIHVARIEKGITEEQRAKMKNGELPDPEEMCFTGIEGFRMVRRSNLYRSADVFGNNLVPYCWKAHGGPMEWFGQRVSHWMPLPEAPKMKGGAE